MNRLILAVLLAPAALHTQERDYDPAPLIAAAIKYAMTPRATVAEVREFARANGVPVPEGLSDTPTRYKLSRAFYAFERPERRDAASRVPLPTRQTTENVALASAIATRLGLATTADGATEERTCRQAPTQEGATRQVCRFAQTDAVIAASLPVSSGDTARVDITVWLNSYQANRGIGFAVSEVTLVRTNDIWEAVSRRNLASGH